MFENIDVIMANVTLKKGVTESSIRKEFKKLIINCATECFEVKTLWEQNGVINSAEEFVKVVLKKNCL